MAPSVRDANGTGLRPKAIFVTDTTGRDGVAPSIRDANRTSLRPKAIFVTDATGRRHAGPAQGRKTPERRFVKWPLSRIQIYQRRGLVCGLPEGLNA